MPEGAKHLAIDSLWYERLIAIGKSEKDVPDSLAGEKSSREMQKNQFLEGKIRNPDLETPYIDAERLIQNEEELLRLKAEIATQESDELVRQIYRWKINERIASIRMLRAAHDGKMRTFKRYCEFIYGRPSKEIFAYTLNGIKQRANSALKSENSDLAEAAADLLHALPDFDRLPEERRPKGDTLDFAEQHVKSEFSDLLAIDEFDGSLSGELLCSAFEDALDTLGVSLKEGGDWKVIMDRETDSRVVSVDQNSLAVMVPESAKFTYKQLLPWLVHEIGTHVLRRHNGERTKLMLLGIGLDRYEGGEEGVATMRGQAVEDGTLDDYAGLRYHLVASLALGLDGKPRDFRDVFEILEKYHIFNYLSKEKSKERATKLGRSLAYNDCVRLFRGTDCGPGVVFTKDIAYREANMGIYDLIGTDEGKIEMMRFSVGKYDPMNPRHIWILNQLGISEDDLLELEHE